jgi:hypothetical protein
LPYIQQCQRSLIDPSIIKLAKDIKHVAKKLASDDSDQSLKIVPGLANYSITALMLTLIGDQEPSYATYNAVIGVWKLRSKSSTGPMSHLSKTRSSSRTAQSCPSKFPKRSTKVSTT